MYRSLMLTLDGTAFADRAVAHARDVALSNGARIILLDVIREHQAPFPFSVEAARMAERREAEQHLQEVRASLLAAGVKQVDVMTVQSDSPTEAIARTACLAWRDGGHCSNAGGGEVATCSECKYSQCDAVVMATHDRSGLQRLLEGSVAQGVAQRLKRMDMLLVRPEAAAV